MTALVIYSPLKRSAFFFKNENDRLTGPILSRRFISGPKTSGIVWREKKTRDRGKPLNLTDTFRSGAKNWDKPSYKTEKNNLVLPMSGLDMLFDRL